jgi:hypothetical protein
MPETATAIPKKITKTTVVTTQAVGADDAEALPFYRRDFWEIINTLTPEDWHEHLVRVYRADDKWENDTAPEGNKFTDHFDEDSVRAKWGGGRYNLWLYGPPSGTKMVRRPFRLTLAGAPKYSHGANGTGNGEDSSALKMVLAELLQELRAARGGTVGQDALRGALDLQAAALKSGVETVRSLNPSAAAPAEKSSLERAMDKLMEITITRMMSGEQDPFQKKIQEVMLDRMLNPANPIEQVRTILTAVKDITGAGGKTDFSTIANTFVAQLPTLIDKAATGVREYRLANESAERVFKLQKEHNLGGPGVIDVPASSEAAPSPAAASSAPQTATPAPAAATVVEVGGPTIEWVQLRIVQIIQKNPEATGEDLYDFLEAVAQELNDQLGAQTAEGLVEIFKSQPILAKIADHPRLAKIIDQYLAYVKERAKEKPV